MALTDVDICNLAQMKLGAEEINSLSAAQTGAEKRYARLFPHYRDVELRARRWAFAMVRQASLQLLAGTTTDVDRPYRFLLPTNCLRPVRGKRDRWQQFGRYIYHDDSGEFLIDYIRSDVVPGEYDPNFAEVLACRLAVEMCEKTTQSKSKRDDLVISRREALALAGQTNAFTIGPEDVDSDEDDWLAARI